MKTINTTEQAAVNGGVVDSGNGQGCTGVGGGIGGIVSTLLGTEALE